MNAAIAALALGILPAGAAAAGATAPKLTVRVAPTTLHPRQSNKVYLTVTYDKKVTRTSPYLVAYVQFAGSVCRGTAKAERAVRGARFDWAGQVSSSPFLRWDSWTMGKALGTRRVCAYLYALRSDPRPLLTASATYRVV